MGKTKQNTGKSTTKITKAKPSAKSGHNANSKTDLRKTLDSKKSSKKKKKYVKKFVDGSPDQPDRPLPKTTKLNIKNKNKQKLPVDEVTLMQFLEKRFNPEAPHVLDLASQFEDPFWTGKKTRLSLSNKIDIELLAKILKEKLPNTTILGLADNKLKHATVLEPLIYALPNVQHLSLKDNHFPILHNITSVFSRWTNLVEIILNGNPCIKGKSYLTIAQELQKNGRFSQLRLMNEENLAEILAKEAAKAAAGPIMLPPSNPIGMSEDEAAQCKAPLEQFLLAYIHAFDDAATGRQGLFNFYGQKSCFSMMVQGVTKREDRGPENEIGHLFQHTRRLNDNKKREKRKNSRLTVLTALEKLPKTKHLLDTMSFDLAYRSDLHWHVAFSGRLLEESKKTGSKVEYYTRDFSRTFVLEPSQNQLGLEIVNDLLVLCAIGKSKVASAPPKLEAPGVSEANKEAMVMRFSQESGMTLAASKTSLEVSAWDYNAAGRSFIERQRQGKITKSMMKS